MSPDPQTAATTSYVIQAPGLNEALESMRLGGHVHLHNQDDAADRMCSAKSPCEGHDRIYLEGAESS